MTDKYPDDCKERLGENPLVCKIFDPMSCAMYHTMIFFHDGGKGKGACCYYEAKP